VPLSDLAVDAAVDDLGSGVWFSVRVHRLRLVLRDDVYLILGKSRPGSGISFVPPFCLAAMLVWFASAPENLCGSKLPRAGVCQSNALIRLSRRGPCPGGPVTRSARPRAPRAGPGSSRGGPWRF